MRKRTGDLKLIKELNKTLILDKIRREGPISRAEIAKIMQISATTVTSAVSELIRDSYVYEDGRGTSIGGRRPILLKVNPNTFFLIGIAIDASKLTIAELNLNAQVKLKEVYPLEKNLYDSFSSFVIDVIGNFLERYPDLDYCLGISITTQGIVDSVNGIILYNPKLNIENLHLKSLVERQFNIKTYIDNDTNGDILAEKGFGFYQQSRNLIYVTIGDGVGAGILINDSVFRGFHGGAGEFGHTTIDYNGKPCSCGNKGCLENYVSWKAIHTKILTEINNGTSTVILEKTKGDLMKITPGIFRYALNEGDALSISILDEVAVYLATGLVNIVSLFNPEKIIIGGDLAFDNPYLIKKVNEHLLTHSLKTLTNGFEVVPTSFGSDYDVVGSGALLLHELFNFTLH